MMQWWMEHSKPILDSFVYSILGSAILLLAFWLIAKMLPFSMRKEIADDQNVSLGIILGALILGLSLIIAAAIHS
jgi:putative membrane protein